MVCLLDELEPPSPPLAVMTAREPLFAVRRDISTSFRQRWPWSFACGAKGWGHIERWNWQRFLRYSLEGLPGGTDVAVKHIKVRNAKRLQVSVESEIKVHDLVRHPNIVQIIAIPVLKNAIYLLSELIKGPNLDDFLFSDDKISTHFTIQSCTKFHLSKHIYQAVA